MPHK